MVVVPSKTSEGFTRVVTLQDVADRLERMLDLQNHNADEVERLKLDIEIQIRREGDARRRTVEAKAHAA